jgi:ADP-heptose:LPS heptosyltransferase
MKALLPLLYYRVFWNRWGEPSRPFTPEQVHKILVVRNDNIGDVVCTTPAIRTLRRHFPRAFIGVLVCRLTEAVVVGNPYVDRVYVYDKAKHGRYRSPLTAWWKQWGVIREIRREGFDLAVGFRSKFSSPQGWLVFSSRAPFRLGHRAEGKEEKFAFFYNLLVEKREPEVHEVRRSLHMLRRIGIEDFETELCFPLDSADRERAGAFLREQGLGQRPLVDVHLTARREEGRSWPADYYVDLLGRLRDRPDCDCLFTYGPDQVENARKILADLPQPPPSFCSPRLQEFAALVARCSLMITLEGGPMHVGAALGTPLLALYGKTDPAVWHPWNCPHRVLRRGRQESLITVDEVWGEVEGFLDRGGFGPPGGNG